jgi:hypothetical protein
MYRCVRRGKVGVQGSRTQCRHWVRETSRPDTVLAVTQHKVCSVMSSSLASADVCEGRMGALCWSLNSNKFVQEGRC